ncbi:MAG TPA: zinc ribbon domain-containing protein [Gaiellaceae bacterium]|jgi:putative FmdB family regulatory protein|nr:zinc ribbon domain-containing protein [Gaiellaceae bacterium]
MPIYEYKCPNGHAFEVFHGISEPAPEACPVCGEGPVARVLHPVAVHFKGSGFYSTDYGRGRKARDGDKPEKTDAGEKKTEPEKKAPAAETT